MEKGREGGREEGRKEGRMEGRKQGRKEWSKEGRKKAGKEGVKQGRKEESREGRSEARKEGRKQGRKEWSKDGRKKAGKEGVKQGRKEESREGRSEARKEGRKQGREQGKKGERKEGKERTNEEGGKKLAQLKVRKYAQQNCTTCRATLLHLLRCKLQSDAARISTLVTTCQVTRSLLQVEKLCWQKVEVLSTFQPATFFCVTSCVGGTTNNIALQLATQQCCTTSCTILLRVFPHLKTTNDHHPLVGTTDAKRLRPGQDRLPLRYRTGPKESRGARTAQHCQPKTKGLSRKGKENLWWVPRYNLRHIQNFLQTLLYCVENKILCLSCIHIHVSSHAQPLNKEMIL